MSAKPSFQQLLQQSPVPVLVDFWAEWCGPCRQVSPVVEKFAAQHGSKVKVIKINVDKNRALAEQHRIQSIPTLILFRRGQVAWRHTGVISYHELATELKLALDL